jgi:hypothetical protein
MATTDLSAIPASDIPHRPYSKKPRSVVRLTSSASSTAPGERSICRRDRQPSYLNTGSLWRKIFT